MTAMPSLRKYSFIFWLLVFTNLLAILIASQGLFFITKMLLMPALVILLINTTTRITGKKLIITSLLFSWLGDVLLLFEWRQALFFIAGLSSFLIAHIFYIICFLSFKSSAPSLLKKHPIYLLLPMLYGACLVWLLFANLGQLKIPVIIYATVICSMLLCSIHIYLKVKKPAGNYYVWGAALFVLSDSILAVNKFYQSLPISGILIMATYCMAQYCIVMGFLKMKSRQPGVLPFT